MTIQEGMLVKAIDSLYAKRHLGDKEYVVEKIIPVLSTYANIVGIEQAAILKDFPIAVEIILLEEANK